MANAVLLNRLVEVLGAEPHPRKPDKWQFRCWTTAHKRGDEHPSGEVFLCHDNPTFGCWNCSFGAGKETARLYRQSTLSHFGTSWRELLRGTGDGDWRPQVKQRPVAWFDYCDHAGVLKYQKVRLEPGRNGRSKDFLFRRPAVPGARPSNLDRPAWQDGLGDQPHLLYRLPDLLSALALDPQRPVVVVEGERKADFLWEMGLAATTTDTGSGGVWQPEYGEILGGRRVVLVPDHDPPGWRHMAEVAFGLQAYAGRVRWLKLPGLRDSQDVLDWKSVLLGLDCDVRTELDRVMDHAPELG